METVESVLKRFTRMLSVLEGIIARKVEQIGLFSLEYQKLGEDLI